MRLYELKGNAVVVMYAYSNPPTKEYQMYFNEVIRKSSVSDHIVFLNPYVDSSLNPLEFKENLQVNQRVFPKVNFSDKEVKSPKEIIDILKGKYTSMLFLTKPEDKQLYLDLQSYAEDNGFVSFSVEALGVYKNHNKIARDAVKVNDYDKFVTCFDIPSKRILSKLYIDLRRAMVGKINESYSRKEPTLSKTVHPLIEDFKSKTNGLLLESYITTDKFGNQVFNSIKTNMSIVEMKSANKPYIGKNKLENKDILIVPELSSKYIRTNEELLSNLLETTVASNVASIPFPMGGESNLIRRTGDPVSVVMGMMPSNSIDKISDATRIFINEFGYINNCVIAEIRKRIDD